MATRFAVGPLRRRRRPAGRGEQPVFISSFSVEGLFGDLDYREKRLISNQALGGRLNVIFGDNGTGKTTILRLIYAALSPETNAGLRNTIAKAPFRSFSLSFSDGSLISVSKTEGLIGPYKFTAHSEIGSIDVNVATDSDNDVPIQDSVTEIELFLRRFDVDVLFVDHERYVRSTYQFLSEAFLEDTDRWNALALSVSNLYEAKSRTRARDRSLQFPLAGMVDAVNNIFRAQAFRQGSQGDANASAVYLEIAKALVRKKKPGPSPKQEEIPFDAQLDELKQRTKSFLNHGLLSDYPFDDLKTLYLNATRPKQQQIAAALSPFVASIERRMSSLDVVHDLMTTFEIELNKYLKKKRAKVHALDGLTIGHGEDRLGLQDLSSGEKQLVFLLCAAVVSRGARSLILIDEPELSLNYKWQRLIAQSLSKLSSPKSTQFIMASHSIEIISRFSDTAVELVDDTPETND
jgi:ABC-type cobalamin/Fe3+-siderophores transport system ATPase subunit